MKRPILETEKPREQPMTIWVDARVGEKMQSRMNMDMADKIKENIR